MTCPKEKETAGIKLLPMDCYVINLECSKDRWTRVSQSFSIPGIRLIRIEAVNGLQLTFPQKDFAERRYRMIHGKRTNPSEVGCFLSHMKAIRAFWESRAEYALICEDDVSAAPRFMEVLQEALRYQTSWDLLRLNCLKEPYGFSVETLGHGYFLHIPVSWCGGAGAYVLNRKAAKGILQCALPMRHPYDHIFEQNWRMGFNIAMVKPFPIVLNETSRNSCIGASHSYKLPFLRRYFLTWTLPYRGYMALGRLVKQYVSLIRYLICR
ncbi:MAG: glycosyltransferase family 25 protein [Planctomycetaceae bacterium]|jgi:glycosyl transferase family 25|nr:glycosyltransferase family 25 protein [Planctomycetaceae bacterium]